MTILPFSRILISLIIFVLGLVEAIIGLRIILKLFAASPQAPFVQWVYGVSGSLLAPFEGMFPSPAVNGGSVLEFSALFALIMYAVFAFLLGELIEFVDSAAVSRREMVSAKRHKN